MAATTIDINIILRALEIRPVFAPKVVGACCILHNICVAAHDILEEEHEQDEEEMAEMARAMERGTKGTCQGRRSGGIWQASSLLLRICLHGWVNMTTSRE